MPIPKHLMHMTKKTRQDLGYEEKPYSGFNVQSTPDPIKERKWMIDSFNDRTAKSTHAMKQHAERVIKRRNEGEAVSMIRVRFSGLNYPAAPAKFWAMIEDRVAYNRTNAHYKWDDIG